jgi:hypothetical protein
VLPAGALAIVVLCYQGALRGIPWLGVVSLSVLLPVLTVLSTNRKQRLVNVAVVGAIGFAMDSALIATGVYTVLPGGRWLLPAPLCPEWILVLWLNYGFVLVGYAPGLRRKMIVPVLVGVFFAVLIYGNAFRYGLLEPGLPGHGSVIVTGALWAVSNPLLVILTMALAGKAGADPPKQHPG